MSSIPSKDFNPAGGTKPPEPPPVKNPSTIDDQANKTAKAASVVQPEEAQVKSTVHDAGPIAPSGNYENATQAALNLAKEIANKYAKQKKGDEDPKAPLPAAASAGVGTQSTKNNGLREYLAGDIPVHEATGSNPVSKSADVTFHKNPFIPKIDLLWGVLGERSWKNIKKRPNRPLDADLLTVVKCPPITASSYPVPKKMNLFWKTIFEDQYSIFDLTGQINTYYPKELNQEETFGDVKVKLLEIAGMRRTYQLTDKLTGVSKNINRYHFEQWPDGSVISVSTLKDLVEKVEKEREQHPNIWIHCQGGCGRTGTLVTACMLKSLIDQKIIRHEDLDGFLLDLIVSLRKQRHPFFVETRQQFALLYKYAESLLPKDESDTKSSKG